MPIIRRFYHDKNSKHIKSICLSINKKKEGYCKITTFKKDINNNFIICYNKFETYLYNINYNNGLRNGIVISYHQKRYLNKLSISINNKVIKTVIYIKLS